MFKLFSTDDDRQAPWERLPCSAITPKYGMALYMTSGKLAIAATSNKPQYICMREESAAVAAGTVIPVVKIQKDQVWETELGTQGTLVLGTSYDVNAGGLTVKYEATPTNGGFVPNYAAGAAVGDTVRGRFDI